MPVVVNRNGAEVPLTITPSIRTENGEQAGFLDFIPDYGGLPIGRRRFTGSPAEEAGLKSGDRLVKVGTKT